MNRTTTTLRGYRARYPHTAISTLTQSGLIGQLLDRQRRRAAKPARRHARWRSIYAAPRRAFVGIWRALTVAAGQRTMRSVTARHRA
jgi:K+-sensing histidine kinase KdpD